jgi:predicted LPLAT superfamily acyltransferase
MAAQGGLVLMSAPVSISAAGHATRNPGPSWGYRFLRGCDRVLPEAVFRPLRGIGTAIAMAGMPDQRRHSREYLSLALRRPPTSRDVWRHFFAFEEALMVKLRVINGRSHRTDFGPGSGDFRTWLEGGGPVLLGSFHVGVSDLLGCQIGGYGSQEIYVVRQRVGNSHDTDKLAERFGGRLHFLWVNEPEEMIFALKEAAATPAAIALQCDRTEFAARTEEFEFLGIRRRFPVTIYHLALIFGRPVLLSVGLPDGPERAVLHSSPRFDLRPGEPRSEALQRARAHFQAFLFQLEQLLFQQPYLWSNFTPLNPPAVPAGTSHR